jgi:hypothetical protein
MPLPRAGSALLEGNVSTTVLIFGRRHLQRVLGAYIEHYNPR